MAYVEPHKDDPIAGTRVHVFSADRSQDLGPGTYCGRVVVTDAVVDAGPDWMGVTTPEIELANGEKIYGIQCWWCPTPEPASLN
ncbi:MAG: hypothetical protein KBD06_04805 [Candidatus Pacebacteria bacterium]|nr:hypothetical protein [Candidatus Paceibacterota bacterium]